MHQPSDEQVDFTTMLGLYRTKLAQAHEEIILLEARLLNRDREIAELRGQRAD